MRCELPKMKRTPKVGIIKATKHRRTPKCFAQNSVPRDHRVTHVGRGLVTHWFEKGDDTQARLACQRADLGHGEGPIDAVQQEIVEVDISAGHMVVEIGIAAEEVGGRQETDIHS